MVAYPDVLLRHAQAENDLTNMSRKVLDRQLRAWNRKPGLRLLYGRWFDMVRREMSEVQGPALEVGSGIGKLKEHIPELIALDLEPTCWTELAGDAQRLPIKDETLSNIVAFDVLHHLPRPMRFFREARRALKPGGRIVIMDPYASFFSRIVYGFFHEECLNMDCDPFDEAKALCADEAFDSNQGVATIIFWRHLDDFKKACPGLKIVYRGRMSLLAYPVSGGFSGRSLLPAPLLGALDYIESKCGFLAPAMAFRTLVVLEK